MLLSVVSVSVVAQSSSEVPEGLMNNPVYYTLYRHQVFVRMLKLQTNKCVHKSFVHLLVNLIGCYPRLLMLKFILKNARTLRHIIFLQYYVRMWVG